MHRSVWYADRRRRCPGGRRRGSWPPPAAGRAPRRRHHRRARIRDLDIEFYQARVAAIRGARATSPSSPPSICSGRARPPTTATWSGPKRTRATRSRFGGPEQRSVRRARLEPPGTASVRRALDVAACTARGGFHFGRGARAAGRDRFELGQYDEAGRRARLLATYQSDLGIAPRLARWAELRGQPEEARRLLRQAQGRGATAPRDAAEQLAWFHLRLGDLALRCGHLGEAQRRARGRPRDRSWRLPAARAAGTARTPSAARLARAPPDRGARRLTGRSTPRRSVC